MNVKSVEKKENSVVELVYEIDRDTFQNAIETAYKRERGKITVPGFRKGKAPRKIIEGMYGSGFFYEDAVNDTCFTAYEEAVAQEKLEIMSQPQFEIVEMGPDGYTAKVTVTVHPEVSVTEYKGLEAVKPVMEVTDTELENELQGYVERASRLVTVERPAQNGDTAVIDYEGFKDGVPFEGGKGEKQSLSLGSNTFIPGFEDQVIGLSAGDEKEINVTFPEEYFEKSLAGQPVVFKVKVHEIKESIKPTVDDEFAKDVSEFDTLEEFKNHLREHIAEHHAEDTKNMFRTALLDKLIGNLKCEITEPMVEFELDRMIDEYGNQLSSQGIDFDQYLSFMGMKREDLREQSRDAADHQLRGRMALDAVADAENIVITDEDVEARLKELSDDTGIPADQIKEMLGDDAALRTDLRREKAMNVVEAAAVAVAPAPEEEKKEEEAPAEAKKPARKRTTKKKTEETAPAEEAAVEEVKAEE